MAMALHRDTRFGDWLLILAGSVLAFYVRYCFRNMATIDFEHYTSTWYAAIKAQGLSATGTSVSNYTPPYLYLLYLTARALPGLPAVMAIKVPSVVCDLVCAWLTYRIVWLKYGNTRMPLFAGLVVLLAPTVLINGAYWGQADSIYTALLLACVYGLMCERPVWACLAFGLAFAFKAQSVFLAPLLAALWLRRTLPIWTLVLIPVVYIITMVPAWLEGRPAAELATIYLAQGETFHNLTRNAPSLYSFLSDRYYRPLTIAGLLLAASAGCAYVWLVWKSRARLGPGVLLELALLSLVLMPFVLPKMHDRYFFPADVLSIAYAFYYPRRYYVPIAIGLASLLAYQPYLLGHAVVPLRVLTLVVGAALVAIARGVLPKVTAPPGAPG
jgi:Gpi18-like mannosyltransferase